MVSQAGGQGLAIGWPARQEGKVWLMDGQPGRRARSGDWMASQAGRQGLATGWPARQEDKEHEKIKTLQGCPAREEVKEG